MQFLHSFVDYRKNVYSYYRKTGLKAKIDLGLFSGRMYYMGNKVFNREKTVKDPETKFTHVDNRMIGSMDENETSNFYLFHTTKGYKAFPLMDCKIFHNADNAAHIVSSKVEDTEKAFTEVIAKREKTTVIYSPGPLCLVEIRPHNYSDLLHYKEVRRLLMVKNQPFDIQHSMYLDLLDFLKRGSPVVEEANFWRRMCSRPIRINNT